MSGDAYFDELPPLDAYADDNVFVLPGVEIEPDIGGRDPLPLIDPSLWQGDPPERRWAVDGMVPHAQATLLTGAGSAGKSLVMQLQCTCVALGLPWLGIPVERAVSIYISCEDDEAELWRRQKAICDGLGVTLEDLSGKLFLLSLAGRVDNELAVFDAMGRISVCDRYRDIQDACARVEARHVALDNTGHFFSGNENDRHQVAGFVGLLNGLAALIDGSVVIIGHPNKAGAEYSGSTAWENQVRSRLFMETPSNDDGEPFDPDVRVLRRGKSNYAQKGGELTFRWHKWTFVLPDHLSEDEQISIRQVTQDTAENERFLACLAARSEEKRAVSEQEASPTYAPRIFSKMDMAKGMKMEAFKRAMDRLFRIKAIERGTLPWDKSRGHAAEGLKMTAEFTRERRYNSASDPCVSHASDRAPDMRPTSDAKEEKGCVSLRPAVTPSTTYYEGAYLGVVAPSFADEEPPAWMDEAPPLEPPADRPDFGDFRNNPLFEGR